MENYFVNLLQLESRTEVFRFKFGRFNPLSKIGAEIWALCRTLVSMSQKLQKMKIENIGATGVGRRASALSECAQ